MDIEEIGRSRKGIFRKIWQGWQGLGWRRNLILFLLTVLSTYVVGGPVYCATLMTILLAHELGHYLVSRKYRIPVTLPFFIPLPLPPLGTLGAIIKMKGPMAHRQALFDIAVAGPLAGFFFTIPTIIFGLKISQITPVAELPPYTLQLGESILFHLIAKGVVGIVPEGFEILLHPMAFAGWIGLYVMALNLLPIGQLDGGHVVYALMGRRSRIVYKGVLIAIAAISLLYYRRWLFLILILIVFKIMRHPPPVDDVTPLNTKRRLLGVAILILFILSFTPMPFQF